MDTRRNVTVLDGILSGVREDLEERKRQTSLAELRSRVADMAPALDPLPAFGLPGVSILAEVKRKSPSKGELADIPDPAWLASQYAAGGAAAISVLTERRRFRGSLADLDAVRAQVDIPILRKDFIVDPYQLWEARAHGADLALLMVVSLSGAQLAELLGVCGELGLTALVESHTAEEVGRAVDSGAKLLGINARDLTTLKVDRSVFAELAPLIPEGAVRVAESGVAGPHDVATYRRWGADVVLVGEALVRSGDPRTAVRGFIKSANASAARS
jgi:indole-3-glycerol phosphate synthase